MDYQLLSRVESHATDLFKLGQELEDAEEAVERKVEAGVRRARKTKGPLFTGTLPTSSPKRKPLTAQDDAILRTESPKLGLPKSKSVPFSLDTLKEDDEEIVTDKKGEDVVAKAPRPRFSDDFLRSFSMRRLSVEEQQRIHYEDLFGCFTRNFGKGFALGFGGKVLLNVFTELVSALRSRKIHWDIITRSIEGGKEHGLFLAVLLASHNSIMYMTKDAEHEHIRYRGSVAGFLAGLVSIAYLPPIMRRSVVLFTFVRAFELACMMLTRRKLLPSLKNGDTALMSASSAVMIYTWLFHPKALDKSYVHFLTRQVQVPVAIVQAMADAQAGLPLSNLDAVNAARRAMAPKGRDIVSFVDPRDYDSPALSIAERAGAILHPGQSFSEFATRYFINGIKNAVPVYVPVYAVPLVLFSRKRLIRDPINTLKHAAMGASRSTIFLATYCTLGICSLSLGRRLGMRFDVMGKAAKALPFLVGLVAGTATLLEKKSRRIELALYVMSKAVEGVHNVLKEKLGANIASPPFGENVLFAACFAIICHANLRQPELVRDSYRGLLMRFFDTDERHKFLF